MIFHGLAFYKLGIEGIINSEGSFFMVILINIYRANLFRRASVYILH